MKHNCKKDILVNDGNKKRFRCKQCIKEELKDLREILKGMEFMKENVLMKENKKYYENQVKLYKKLIKQIENGNRNKIR